MGWGEGHIDRAVHGAGGASGSGLLILSVVVSLWELRPEVLLLSVVNCVEATVVSLALR